jgi:hypothetical protein
MTSIHVFYLAHNLYKQIIDNITISNFKVITVLSDECLNSLYYYDEKKSILYLKIKEFYTYLSLKTEIMLRSCLKIFDFDYLVKWDVSTYHKNKKRESEYDRVNWSFDKSLFCLDQVNSQLYIKEKKNYWSHLRAACDGKTSAQWFMKKKSYALPIIEKEGRNLNAELFIPYKLNYFR